MKTYSYLSLATAAVLLVSCWGGKPAKTEIPEDVEKVQTEKHIEVVVHRGANALAPENTMPSADSALAHGAEWIEVDVRSSKDGVMYNMHDPIFNRTTDGFGFVHNNTSDYIDKLDAGSWFSDEYKGLHVPTIRYMLENLKGRARVFFDVKNCNLPDLVALARETGFVGDSSFFWFGKEEMLREFLTIAPDLQVKVNAGDTVKMQYWIDLFAEVAAQNGREATMPKIVEVHADALTPEFQDYCSRYGIKTMVGAQGETLEDYRKTIEAGADMINLDKPELFEQLIAE